MAIIHGFVYQLLAFTYLEPSKCWVPIKCNILYHNYIYYPSAFLRLKVDFKKLKHSCVSTVLKIGVHFLEKSLFWLEKCRHLQIFWETWHS